MGAKIPGPHKCFNMRNPFARAIILGIGLLALCALLTRANQLDVRTSIVRTGAFTKDPIASQRPLEHGDTLGQNPEISKEEDTSRDTTSTIHTFPNTSQAMRCDYNMERLRRWQANYDLEEKFEYTKRYVRAERLNIPRKSLTTLRQNFFAERIKTLNISKNYKPDICPEPLVVPVSKSPFPSTVNASALRITTCPPS